MGNQRFTLGLAKMKLILKEVIFAEIDFRLSNLLRDKFEKSLKFVYLGIFTTIDFCEFVLAKYLSRINLHKIFQNSRNWRKLLLLR